jgi:formate hydrogenlyase subunit 3/multisubunit Na+/H+ antiporter MnhD subunit
MSALWLLPVVVPLAVACLAMLPGNGGRLGLGLAPWAAVPALVFALLPDPGPAATLPWLLLGATLGLDMTGRVFLILAAFLWLTSGMYARRYLRRDPRRARFFVFFLLAMAGNLGIALAQDVATFYLFFALMTFAAYPLIVHAGHAEARRAGRTYLVMAVVGETLLWLAFLLIAWSAGTLALGPVPSVVAASPARDAIIALLLVGFGIKMGALPLHVWLPLAHPVAPTPASAVLSGTMIAAGSLGWLRFLPLGEVDLGGWGSLLIVVGVGSALFGVAVGVTQRDAKVALAYSSISQMGFVTIAVGAGLAATEAWPATQVSVLIFVLHHGLAKGALFLGVGVAAETARVGRRRLLFLGAMALPALALVGAPFTSGELAKLGLKDAAALAPPPWAAWLGLLLPIAAVGTALLMARVLTILPAADEGGRHDPDHGERPPAPSAGLVVPWVVVLAGVALATLAVPAAVGIGIQGDPLDPARLWTSTWPVGVGLLLFWGGRRALRRTGREISPIAAGDLLIPLERSIGRHASGRVMERPDRVRLVATATARRWVLRLAGSGSARLAELEARLTSWTAAGVIFVALLLGIVVAMVRP